ncbi:Na/Pi cotransporter family protein [Marinobacter sp. F4206]|uniref:Na/Pi cotransporter family protein n=1 Tax=Marinobacter sp. F4206 TaxID=2861777 RepID=UPI001C5DA731|nr:Na/Pi symporter [Marinobacter sp. F4206]MBW4934754.1 Na/Pi symporter [Marinobacter sp. F4206]
MTDSIFQILGGVALFLLAMEMMTDGLKHAAGHQLRHMLADWTKTPLKGFGTGFLITGIVQSSSAVTIATIGFVNAGLLSLGQSLGVIFGANVGTTMTGWLVSLVGFGVKIEAFAMPMLAIGMMLRLISSGHRGKAVGETLAGFALFFLALALLKDSLGVFTEGVDGEGMLGQNYSLPMFLLFGFMATLLTQSSSAALAIILSAASSNLLSIESAAVAVIGTNLGTTSTAAIAVLNATANARRLALAHVTFNLVAGAIALVILPLLIWLATALAQWIELDASPAVSLALFHTLFNVLGAAVMLPLAPRFSRYLSRLFRSKEEDNAEPRYLDDTLVTTPELAVGAVDQEMIRLISLTRGILRVCVDREDLKPGQIQPKSESALSLNAAITDYISRLRAEKMHPTTVDALTRSILTCRYLAEATDLAPALLQLRKARQQQELAPLRTVLERYLDVLRTLIASEDTSPGTFDDAEQTYHQLKSSLLEMVVKRDVPTSSGDRLLDDLSSVRRLSDQWNKSLQWKPGTDALIEDDQALSRKNRQ